VSTVALTSACSSSSCCHLLCVVKLSPHHLPAYGRVLVVLELNLFVEFDFCSAVFDIVESVVCTVMLFANDELFVRASSQRVNVMTSLLTRWRNFFYTEWLFN
jgi:hypothetical protein